MAEPNQREIELRGRVYEPFVQEVEQSIEQITKEPPDKWLRHAYRTLIRMERDLTRDDTRGEEVRSFVTSRVEQIKSVLRGEASMVSQGTPIERARVVIHQLSDLMSMESETKEPVEIKRMSMDEVITAAETNPDGYRLRLSVHTDGETKINDIEVYSPTRQEWFTFPLPQSETMVHKGGCPRVVLKIVSGAPVSTIEAELPPNDFDVVSWGGDEASYKEAALLGVDPAGVEMVHSADFVALCRTRDTALNGCFLGRDGLVYSTAAYAAAKSGKTEPLPSFRGLYGTNMFVKDGELLYNGRDMMRAMKVVAEGKALTFDFKEVNKQVDIGVYALSLADKFLRKENASELLRRMFYLMQQLGQVRAGEESIFDVLDRIHGEYPFFEFDKEPLDDEGVAKWLATKLGKQILRVFRIEYGIASDLELTRSEGDTIPREVNLSGFKPDQIPTDWEYQRTAFLDRCRERKRIYDEANVEK